MITIYAPTGRSAEVSENSLRHWVAVGWSTDPPGDTAVPKKLRKPVAHTQVSDVTQPGESEVEGVTPEDEE